MALFTKSELEQARREGLVITDYENENPYADNKIYERWSNEQFEKFLSEKEWSDSIKDRHRKEFKGGVCIQNGTISYE